MRAFAQVFGGVKHERASGPRKLRPARNSEAVEVCNFQSIEQLRCAEIGRKAVVVQERYGAQVNYVSEKHVPRGKFFVGIATLFEGFGQDNFLGIARREHGQEVFGFVEFGAEEVGSAQVEPRGVEGFRPVEVERKHEVAVDSLQVVVVYCSAGGEDSAERTLDDFPRFGVFVLLANGDFFARFQQLLNVSVGAVVGHARHRVVVAFCERNSQYARAFKGVVVEHFVKIAESEHKHGVLRQRAAHLPVLFHHRSIFVCVGHFFLTES